MPPTTYTAGMEIQNGPGAEGALGCFARPVSQPNTTVLLSCAHVLFGEARNMTNLKVHQPISSSSCCRGDHIANTLKTWADGFLAATDNVSGSPQQTGSETDCAIAQLRSTVTSFNNTLPGGIGMISGTPAAGDLGVVVGPPPGTVPTTQQLVRMWSVMDKTVKFGTVIRPTGSTATYAGSGQPVPDLLYPFPISDPLDDLADAADNINQLLILPRVPPGANLSALAASGRKLDFCQGGDSGSVVVNSANQVIGVLCRRTRLPLPQTQPEFQIAGWVGVVNPIAKVLQQMQIAIPPNLASTSPVAGAPVRVFLAGSADRPQSSPVSPAPLAPLVPTLPRGEKRLVEGVERLRRELGRTRQGRLILAKVERHRKEVGKLVNTVRQVLVAWHRHQGPAFLKHCLESVRDPEHLIPGVINGVTQAELLAVMGEMLARFGSAGLRRDVLRYRGLVLRRLAGASRLDQLAQAMALAPLDRDTAWSGEP